jgi:xenotropic and polytropic retrovirus receptor 1
MKRLRVPPLGEQQSPWTTFKLGLFSGAFGILFITAALSGNSICHFFLNLLFYNTSFHIVIFSPARKDWLIIFQLYRGPLLLIEFIFLMGVNVYGWRSSGVNHVLIFELDPRHHLSEQHLMELAAIFGVIWALSLLGLLYSERLSIPAYYSPVALAVVMTIFLINPVLMSKMFG